jgi:Uma2 family endonuclease
MSTAASLNWPALIAAVRGGKRLVLQELDWQDYQAFLDELGDKGLRHTYDRGSLEIMPTSREHEIYLCLLGLLISVLAEELGRRLSLGGQVTLERQDLDRGLEPDACFWLAKDPPPDLYVEIEISRTLVHRLPVLAALGVPEVWRVDGRNLRIGLLQADGEYQWVEQSPTFPEVSPQDIFRFLRESHQNSDHIGIVREFRAWLKAKIAN